MAKLRTFIAADASGEVRSHVGRLVKQFAVADADVKWVDGEQLHWTLKFLGDVDESEAYAICQAVTEVVRPLAPIDVVAQGVGAFPNVHRPRTVWIGATDGAKALCRLVAQLEARLAKLGFRREGRRYTPHLTIGRVRSGRNVVALAELLDKHRDFDAGRAMIEEIVVYSSELTPTGPIHQALAHVPLEGQ